MGLVEAGVRLGVVYSLPCVLLESVPRLGTLARSQLRTCEPHERARLSPASLRARAALERPTRTDRRQSACIRGLGAVSKRTTGLVRHLQRLLIRFALTDATCVAYGADLVHGRRHRRPVWPRLFGALKEIASMNRACTPRFAWPARDVGPLVDVARGWALRRGGLTAPSTLALASADGDTEVLTLLAPTRVQSLAELGGRTLTVG
jgi:hypothetical protein